MAAPPIMLNHGDRISSLGFGVFQVPPESTTQAVSTALQVGYRHIDTAAAYNNERETGQAIAESGLAREDVFLVTKLWNADQGYDETLAAFDKSAERLGLDQLGGYLDLYLIHWPVPAIGNFVDTFRAFAALRDLGRIRSIGVSNFAPEPL